MKKDDAIERLITRPAVMVDGQTTIRRATALLTDESIRLDEGDGRRRATSRDVVERTERDRSEEDEPDEPSDHGGHSEGSGSGTGNRTPVTAVKGRCPNH